LIRQPRGGEKYLRAREPREERFLMAFIEFAARIIEEQHGHLAAGELQVRHLQKK